jgi:hypothetical protein
LCVLCCVGVRGPLAHSHTHSLSFSRTHTVSFRCPYTSLHTQTLRTQTHNTNTHAHTHTHSLTLSHTHQPTSTSSTNPTHAKSRSPLLLSPLPGHVARIARSPSASSLPTTHQPTNLTLLALLSAARLRFVSARALRAVRAPPPFLFLMPLCCTRFARTASPTSNQPTRHNPTAPTVRRSHPAVPSSPGAGPRLLGGGNRFIRGGFGHLDLANLRPLASRPGCASPAA